MLSRVYLYMGEWQLVIDEEAGTHFELLEKDGPYARLYKIQFSHQKPEKSETQKV